MKLIQSFFTILAISLFMISCGDDGGLTLTVNSPNNDTVYSPGDVIEITGIATDDVGITSIILESQEINVRDVLSVPTQSPVDYGFSISLPADSPLLDDIKLTVSAVDDEGNMVSEERTISIQ